MKRIFHNSDFQLKLNISDYCGNPVNLANCNWQALFWTGNKFNSYRVGYFDGNPINFYTRNGEIFAVFKDHGLEPGQLSCELTLFEVNSSFPEGVEKRVFPGDLPVIIDETNYSPLMEFDADVVNPPRQQTIIDDVTLVETINQAIQTHEERVLKEIRENVIPLSDSDISDIAEDIFEI